MRKFILAALVCFYVLPLYSKGYSITVEVEGVQDSALILAVYSGEKRFVVDSTTLDSKGKAIFAKDKPLEAGMYLIIMNRSILFDLLISDAGTQTFSAYLDKSLRKAPEFKNSPENTAFYAYHQLKNTITQQQQEIVKQLATANNERTQDSLSAEAKRLRKSLAQYSDSVAQEHKGKTIATFLDALNIPEPPEVKVSKSDPKHDSIVYMNHYTFTKDHFFDRIDFSDERLARTPFFGSMLMYYFDNVLLYQQSDSIIPYADRIIERASKNSFMFRYVLSNLFNHYMQSKLMGQEGVVVHLAEKYYLNDERTNWETERFMLDITNFVNRTKPTLLGSDAPDLRMETLSGGYESLKAIDSNYVVLYFYEPGCSQCRKETVEVYKVYEKFRGKGVQVYAVYTQQDKNEWAEYVAEQGLNWINVWDPEDRNGFREKYNVYTTPQIYLLDKAKRVIGRRLDAENLEKILTNVTR